ncbi:MAG: hypothetical protein ACRELC_02115 [Gemmatimonadota bacterium]
MSGRGRLAVAILAVWAGALAWHVKRVHFRPVADLLAAAARTIPPGVAYYALFQGDRRIGWAQTEVDTLPSGTGFLLRDQLIAREPIVPGGSLMRLAVDARLGPTLALESFRLAAEGVPGIRTVDGDVHGDTALELRVRGEDGARRVVIPIEGSIILQAAWPLRFAAQRQVREGVRFEVPTLDPLTGSTRVVGLRVLSSEAKVYPDSVVAEDGWWVPARNDTVWAWHIEHEIGGLALRSWVDEDGRLFRAELPGGLRLERTAFELAYFGERVPGSGDPEPDGDGGPGQRATESTEPRRSDRP